jgi:transposase
MKKEIIIGIDVSKQKLDLYAYKIGKELIVNNNEQGFKSLLQWVKKGLSVEPEQVFVVMEHTGIYTYRLELFLFEQGIAYVKRPALDIKRSVGMKRGKTDRADAKMISQYGWYKKEELTPMAPVKDNFLALEQLMSYRDKLVADRASHKARKKELEQQLAGKIPATIIELSEQMINYLTAQIDELEKQIKDGMAADQDLGRNYQLLNSIKGIGFVNAAHLILITANFTRFSDPRKFACYAGVAPFEHSSGSSIRGKTRVSNLANRKIKSLITQAATSAIQHDVELKLKYLQKIAEGKPRMSAINMIRFKLITRVFAVIRRQTPFTDLPLAA